jgi:predicted enzyme related to lactoylglutathione lyase
MKSSICWFEIPVRNFERAKAFYSKLMEVEIQERQMGNDRMGFIPHAESGSVGAIVAGEDYKPGLNGVMVYFDADPDLSFTLERVEDAGGRIMLPKTLITKEIGYFAVIRDSEGNRIALFSKK